MVHFRYIEHAYDAVERQSAQMRMVKVGAGVELREEDRTDPVLNWQGSELELAGLGP